MFRYIFSRRIGFAMTNGPASLFSGKEFFHRAKEEGKLATVAKNIRGDHEKGFLYFN